MTASTFKLTPVTMVAVGLLFVLLASVTVVQGTSAVTTAPVDSGISGLFEPATGQLTLHQAPYCGPFDILCFLFAILQSVFNRLAAVFGGLGHGGLAHGGLPALPTSQPAPSAQVQSTVTADSTAQTTAGPADCARGDRQCRRDARDALRAAKRAGR